MKNFLRAERLGPCNHLVGHTVGHHVAFIDDEDCLKFHDLIAARLSELGVSVYNYAMIRNHYHILCSEPEDVDRFSATQKVILDQYSRYHSQKYGRVRILWQPRFKSFPVKNDSYALTCAAYIDLNAWRAGLCSAPEMFPWSSANYYLKGETSGLLTPNPCYLDLGHDEDERRSHYRAIINMWINNPVHKDDVRRFFKSQPNTLHPTKAAYHHLRKILTV
jgi:putative transposase